MLKLREHLGSSEGVSPRSRCVLVTSLLCVVLGCEGELDVKQLDAPEAPGSVDANHDVIAPPGDPGSPVTERPSPTQEKVLAACGVNASDQVGDAPMRVISELELNNALGALFPDLSVPTRRMSRDGRAGSFVINSVGDVEKAHIEDFRLMAEEMSVFAHGHAEQLLRCTRYGGREQLFAGSSSGTEAGFESFAIKAGSSTSAIEMILTGNDTADGVEDSWGQNENGWSSIYEVRFWAGDRQLEVASVDGNESLSPHGTPDRSVLVDGDPESRWAQHGEMTLTFNLATPSEVDRVEVLWFNGDKRKALFELYALEASATLDESECRAAFIDRFVGAAFRRPLEPTERTRLESLFDAGAAEGGMSEGVRFVVEATLQAPSFIYVHEDASLGARALDNFELAQRMATLIWRGLPDDELVNLAREGRLTDPVVREAQARRMLDDPRAHTALRELVKQWFGFDQLRAVDLVGQGAEPLDDERATTLYTSMMREANATIEASLRESRDYKRLLTRRSSYMDDVLLAHHGVTGEAARYDEAMGMSEVTWTDRSGLMGLSAFLTLYNEPIHRGLFFRKRLLCDVVPGPDDIDTNAIPTGPTESERSKSEKRLEHPVCGGCHQLMDPMGLALDTFDELGRSRSMDRHANLVTSSGGVRYWDADDVDVNGLLELAELLAGSPDVDACVAQSVFTYAFGRLAEDGDACTLAKLEDALAVHEGDLDEALITLISADNFLMLAGE